MKILNQIQANKLTNETQRVGLKLLKAEGEWKTLKQLAPSIATEGTAARIRDLRKGQFGGFQVECKSASELGRRSARRGQFYYRIPPRTVRAWAVKKLFKI